MAGEMTTVEVMGLAIRSEEDAAAFYGELSKRIHNELVRAKYEALAREEVSHKLILMKLYKKLTGEEQPPAIPGKPQTAEGAQPSGAPESLESLLELAIQREHEAHAFYRDMAKGLKDVNARRTLDYLAGIERGHETMLQAELEAYRKDKHWYAEKPDIQLV